MGSGKKENDGESPEIAFPKDSAQGEVNISKGFLA
jgi:hypothetical protein